MEAGDNPELRAKLEELEHELEVRLIGFYFRIRMIPC